MHISASIIAADLLNLAKEIEDIINAGVDSIHLDVMDGHYVPNFTFGENICNTIKRKFSIPVHAHLMVQSLSIEFVERFVNADVDSITIHLDSAKDIKKILSFIKSKNIRVGLALNPDQSPELLLPFLKELDSITLMTVKPGFAGQKFIPEVLHKVENLKKLLNPDIQLVVDGGINLETARMCKAQGLNNFVIGSALFSNINYSGFVDSFKKISAQ